ncbi:hypothetical protein GQ55_2G360100 [Panicum hallii var. hallii]|uniref:Protein FAR1-RELATED SEQUENCE n=1 Tax=Panicum hallii var. hallii TaxID=1504633 RepID=A0A2T7EW10_9POAL|nr:hypothetical protein GQ55_2G360100 [Panicum hallii var. hallii]
MEDRTIVKVVDNFNIPREVIFFNADQVHKCSCMLFESIGIPCRYIIRMLRSARISELSMHYITKRWTKNCKREAAFDSEGNLLIEKSITSMEDSTRRKMATAHKKFEDIFQMAKTFEEGVDILIQNLERLSLLFEPISRTR